MNEKKIFQQKILSQVVIGCGLTILLASLFSNRMNSTTVFGLVFFIVGILAFRKAKQDEEQL
jgi:hypothetical protein